jgi:hypothetical protein
LSRCGRPFEPPRRTPRILIRHRYQAVFHRVLMCVVQPRKVRFFLGQSRFTKVVPDLSAGGGVKLVDPFGGLLVQKA